MAQSKAMSLCSSPNIFFHGPKKEQMAPQHPPTAPRLEQQQNGCWLERHFEKRQKLQVWPEEEDASCRRKWDQLDHEILVSIMKRLMRWEIFSSACYVCKSWLSAILDALFPPRRILDLRPFDHIYSNYVRNRYLHYVKLLLHRRPPNHYTKLLLAKSRIPLGAYLYFAERLPALKCVILPAKMRSLYVSPGIFCASPVILFRYWRNLEEAHCCWTMLFRLAACKFIRRLTMFGRVSNDTPSLIAGSFPLLEHLRLPSCILPAEALSKILDGHSNLKYIDARHCICVKKKDHSKLLQDTAEKEWEEELCPKVTCARKDCPCCSCFNP